MEVGPEQGLALAGQRVQKRGTDALAQVPHLSEVVRKEHRPDVRKDGEAVAAEAAFDDVADVHLRDEAADAVFSAPPKKEKSGLFPLCLCTSNRQTRELKDEVFREVLSVDVGEETRDAVLSRPSVGIIRGCWSTDLCILPRKHSLQILQAKFADCIIYEAMWTSPRMHSFGAPLRRKTCNYQY
jgi:hypothetical protein